jgi:hypothetical protein
LSWLIERRSAAGVRRPTTVSFLLVAAALAPCHVVDWLAEAGVWPAARAKRDWMRPSVVRVSADLGDPAELGNDFLPDAVLKHLRNDALPSYVAGHQLQPSQSDVLTPRGAATASTCRNASKPQFRMESLRGSISRSFALARQLDRPSWLSDLQACPSCHSPSDRRRIELTMLSAIGLSGLERP